MKSSELARPVDLPHGSPLYRKLCSSMEWMAQEKVDGMRVMVEVTGCAPRGWSRRGKRVTLMADVDLDAFPLGTVLDGELKADQLWLFDMLSHNGEDCRDRPLSWRWMRMLQYVSPDMEPHVRVVRSAARSIDLKYESWIAEGAEGIVLKSLRDSYPPEGGAQWFKVKP